MGIREKEELLFSDWEKDRQGFIRDGVVDENFYLKSHLKLLFLLKETNGYLPDLREYLSAGGRAATWNNIARWTKGIFSLPQEFSWKEVKYIEKQNRIEILQSICAMNLKKCAGGSSTKKHELDQIALNEDATYIQKQIGIYVPDLIICGGTGYIIRQIFKIDQTSETRNGVVYFQIEPGTIVLDYLHPQARVRGDFLYFHLINAVREILEIRKMRAVS